MGVRVRRTDEEVERSMVVYHIFVSVPRAFGGYCINEGFGVNQRDIFTNSQLDDYQIIDLSLRPYKYFNDLYNLEKVHRQVSH